MRPRTGFPILVLSVVAWAAIAWAGRAVGVWRGWW